MIFKIGADPPGGAVSILLFAPRLYPELEASRTAAPPWGPGPVRVKSAPSESSTILAQNRPHKRQHIRVSSPDSGGAQTQPRGPEGRGPGTPAARIRTFRADAGRARNTVGQQANAVRCGTASRGRTQLPRAHLPPAIGKIRRHPVIQGSPDSDPGKPAADGPQSCHRRPGGMSHAAPAPAVKMFIRIPRIDVEQAEGLRCTACTCAGATIRRRACRFRFPGRRPPPQRIRGRVRVGGRLSRSSGSVRAMPPPCRAGPR